MSLYRRTDRRLNESFDLSAYIDVNVVVGAFSYIMSAASSLAVEQSPYLYGKAKSILMEGQDRFKTWYEIDEANAEKLRKIIAREAQYREQKGRLMPYMKRNNVGFFRKKLLFFQADSYYKKHENTNMYSDDRGVPVIYNTIFVISGYNKDEKIPLLFQFNDQFIFKIALLDPDGNNFTWLTKWNKEFTKYFRK